MIEARTIFYSPIISVSVYKTTLAKICIHPIVHPFVDNNFRAKNNLK